MKAEKFKIFLGGFVLGSLFLLAIVVGGLLDRVGLLPFLNEIAPVQTQSGLIEQKILKEESAVISAAENTANSVVTVSISKTEKIPLFGFDPFNIFNFETRERQIEQDIGSGFVIDKNLIVTNKHVVSDTSASYRIIDVENEVYEVTAIYRDPANDLAILKVDADLPGLTLGDSENLRVGQTVIAIGTALGKFRHTVTTGVISGLGRGITAGSIYEGYVEQLDNVIQTDAAINPGNSGGPLLNSSGQVIGVNVAVAGGAQNIGFAIPINVVKDSLRLFKETGEFNRPFLGVEYQIISQKAAVLNEVPAGAYIRRVVEGSSADIAGIKEGDIITHVDGERLGEKESALAEIINRKKVGDQMEIKLWRDGAIITLKLKLSSRSQ